MNEIINVYRYTLSYYTRKMQARSHGLRKKMGMAPGKNPCFVKERDFCKEILNRIRSAVPRTAIYASERVKISVLLHNRLCLTTSWRLLIKASWGRMINRERELLHSTEAWLRTV